MNNRNLLIFLIVCIAAFFAVQWFNQGQQSTFRTNVTDLDTSLVDRIWVQKGKNAAFEIIHSNGQWNIKSNDRNMLADRRAVQSVLGTLQKLSVESIVAKKEDRWSDYQVDADQATHLKVYSEGEILNNLYLGNFDFNKQTRSAASYVRPAEESTVYKVDGMISMAFQQGATYFYNKTIMNVAPEEISSIQYNVGNRTSSMSQKNGQWYSGNGVRIDSATFQQYISRFSPLKAYNIADLEDGTYTDIPGDHHRLEVTTGGGATKSLEAKFYENTGQFLIRSSEYPETIYASDSSGVYQQVFEAFPGGASETEPIQ